MRRTRRPCVVGVVALVVVFGLRRIAPGVPGALVLVVGGLLASWLLDLGARGVALVGDVPRGLPSFDVPDLTLMWDHVVTVAIAAVALVLIGFSQTAGDARAFAAKHRYQIDIDQESVAQAHGQHRGRVVPGHARLDQPVGELAQRPLRGPDGPGLDHLGRHGAADAARPGAAVLRPAEAGAGGPHHRGGRDGHDGPARDAAARPGPAVRLLGRGRGHRRHAGVRRARRRGDRHRAVAALAGLRGHATRHAGAGRRAGHPGLPRARRAPGRRRFRGSW